MRRPAFTLIEVLVVVAIIALLVAILLPSLTTARDQAKRVVCGSQLRQTGVCLTHYVTANKGQLPVIYRSTTSFTTYYMRFNSVHGGAVNLGLLANRKYANEPDVYYCPGQERVKNAALLKNGPSNQWISQAAWDAMTAAQKDTIRLRSSYPTRLIELPAKNTQIGGKQTYEPLPAGTLGGWRQSDYYQKVLYSDFTGADNWEGGGVGDGGGFVYMPHRRRGVNRLFGDTSVRWASLEPISKLRPVGNTTPTAAEMVAYYRLMDRIP
jgi:prepilin-type N-terminal cleavage/methylation domain-containing protein